MANTQEERARKRSNGDFTVLEAGTKHYLVAPRRGAALATAGMRPISATHMRGLIGSIPDVEIVRTLASRRVPATATAGEASETYVVKMKEEQAELLRQTAPAHLIVEEDALLELGTPVAATKDPPQTATWKSASRLNPRPIKFRVLGDDDEPIVNASVTLHGESFPTQGKTDDKGEVELDLYALAGQKPRSVLVAADRGYWDRYVVEPDVVDGAVNAIRLSSLEKTIRGFPEQYRYGWGARMMGLDRLDPRLTGKGVKIAIVDSGVDNTHPLLRHIEQGLDLTNREDATTWADDVTGHGSHCAGTIAARSESGSSIRGFAPEAEILVLKVFPGGRFSSLIEALDLCLEREIDVVNISLGHTRPSLALEQKLEECAMHGIACIVAAGNSGGQVQYPASSPWTLAVSAVGKLGEVPLDTWEVNTVLPMQVAPDGLFSPSFTSHGPEVGVCAPGVGVISTVPGGFEPQSGTSVAAPHITGLAALLLAHHPWFSTYRGRDGQRVLTLYRMIGSMCTPYAFAPGRTGAGLPRLDPLQQLVASLSAGSATTPTMGAPVGEPITTQYTCDWGINGHQGAAPASPACVASWIVTPTMP